MLGFMMKRRFSIKGLLLVTTIVALLLSMHFGTISAISKAEKRAPSDLARYRGVSLLTIDGTEVFSSARAVYFAPCIVEVETEVYGEMKAGCKQYYVAVFGCCFLTPIRRDNWIGI